MFQLRASMKFFLFSAIGIACAFRIQTLLVALSKGNETPLLVFPLGVIFPATLFIALLLMGPTGTREGIFMRLGTLVHLILIVAFPSFALHLALGFPFVFLTVELFENKLPDPIKEPFSRWVLV